MQRQTNLPIKHEQQPNFDFSRSPTHTLIHTHMPGTRSCANTSRIACSHLGLHAAATSGRCSSCFRIESCSLFSVLCYFLFFFPLLFTLYLGLKCTSCSPVPPLCTVGVKCFRTQSQLQTPEARQLYKVGVEGGDGVAQSNCTGNALKIYFC